MTTCMPAASTSARINNRPDRKNEAPSKKIESRGLFFEVTSGFEPLYEVLQTSA